MSFYIKELDYSIPSMEYFNIIKEDDWSIFLNSNYDRYPDQRFDILTSSPLEKIILEQVLKH